MSSQATLTVSLSKPAPSRVEVGYGTENGTARQSTGYTPVTGQLQFATGEQSKTVSVPVIADALDEPDETFLLRLLTPRGAILREGGDFGRATIIDDDP